ncbi:MAG TPA: V-type ATP synthase subunit B [Candidatus Deferrimicrobium sp.]|nr:V-type ATP synthase subunit B [Candidatus Deferrimicrobium sp.]
MSLVPAVGYTNVTAVNGPLLVVRDVQGVGWDEFAVVRTGGAERHGVVLECDGDLAVVEVLEGTSGIDPHDVVVEFAGRPFSVPVGDGWLGRTANGRGEAIDGGPAVAGAAIVAVGGLPINPTGRAVPESPIITGISAIDGLATLVRGQKLPIFSEGGLPHLEVATQIAAQAHVEDGAFRVIMVALGITHADAAAARDVLEERSESGDLVLIINTADDPVIERILAPRVALTIAEHFAFTAHQHVLVVMCDMTSYAEAVREVGAARGEIPGRRGYPGYLFSDLASIYERCGRVEGSAGSLTQLPVLTMPAGDITHPVPDLTGYITEGQVVFSREMFANGISPPFDALSSLSRLMRHGAGPERTREDHLDVAAQMYAGLSRARQARELADLVGTAALSATDQAYLAFADAVNAGVIAQRAGEDRALEDTLNRAWNSLRALPRRELTMLSPRLIDRYLPPSDDSGGGR